MSNPVPLPIDGSHPERPRLLGTPVDDRSRNLASDQHVVLHDEECDKYDEIDHRSDCQQATLLRPDPDNSALPFFRSISSSR